MGNGQKIMGLAAIAIPATLLAQGTRIVDVTSYPNNGTYAQGAVVQGTSSIGTEPAMLVRFASQWAQFGVKYTSPANWSSFNGFTIRLQNLEAYPVSLGIMFDRNAAYTDASRINLDLAPFQTKLFYVDFTQFDPATKGMRSPMPMIPFEYSHRTPGDRPGRISSLYRWHLYSRYVGSSRVRVSSLYGWNTDTTTNALVDAFGQVTRKSWSWKSVGAQSIINNAFDEEADLAAHPGSGEQFGAVTIPRTSHRGSWRVFKTAGGKSYFLSPEGRYFWSLGICQVGEGSSTIVEGRESMFQGLPAIGSPKAQFYGNHPTNGKRTFCHYNSNLFDKFGETWALAQQTNATRRMLSWGFNTLGTGCDVSQQQYRALPFTFVLNTDRYPNRVTTLGGRTVSDAYGGDFLTWMKVNFRSTILNYLPNPNLMGAFVDGEKPWGSRNGTTRDRLALPLSVLQSGATQPSKVAFVSQLVAKYETIANLNTSWGTSFASWTSLRNTPTTLTDQQMSAAQTDLTGFLKNFAKIYAYRVRTALTSLKPGLIYLGGRENLADAPDEVIQSIAAYTDVISITHYAPAGETPWAYLESLPRPVLISEFSFSSQQGNSMPQVVFPQVECADQTERAQRAAEYLQTALSCKNVLGVHWFRYVDQPVSGHMFAGENYGWGLVDVTDRPYMELIEAFRGFSANMYRQRGV